MGRVLAGIGQVLKLTRMAAVIIVITVEHIAAENA